MVGFVTYAQNFEDLMLWRALHDVEAGFYTDVGAADPDEDSVTRAFYDRGWRGINIEPSPDYFAALSAARPRDVNLCCLVGSESGVMNLYNIPGTGLSTVEREFADRHAADGRPLEVMSVPVRTLADICREFAPPDIHFLKIDVEGAEGDVLRGADFITYRPWVVVVEATEPNSQVENWQGWDPLLTKADYQFVWFDGLNRFYLAAERADDLRHAFRTPPNYFDFWIRPRGLQQMSILNPAREVQDAMERLREETAQARVVLDAEVAAARSEAHSARIEASVVRKETSTVQQELSAVRAEAAALRAALMTVEHEASAARAEADALRLAVAAAENNASVARAEIDRLGAVEQAREHAEARVAALLASTSWKITAPLRGVASLFRTDPVRRRRLALVARVGQRSGDAKGPARLAIYGLGRVVARMPGGHGLARIAASALPGPYRWLHTRYVVYRSITTSPVAMTGDSATSSQTLPVSIYPQAARLVRSDLAAEEQAMLLRLHPRDEAA